MRPTRNLIFLLILAGLSQSLVCQYSTVSSHGLEIGYRTFGQGTPLLILGGGPGDSSDRYLGLCELMSEYFKCILVDQRGTGISKPARYDSTTVNLSLTLSDLEEIRKNMGFKEWNVLGFSYGGFLASLYAETYPSSVSSLVTLGSMGFDFSVFSYFQDNIYSRLQPHDLEKIQFWSDSVQVAGDQHHATVETIRAMLPGYYFDREKALKAGREMKDSDFDFVMGNWIWMDIERNYLNIDKTCSSFTKPVLILHGRQDPLGESVAVSLSRFYSNSKLVFIEKCGHYSWVEQPEKVLISIKEFLLHG